MTRFVALQLSQDHYYAHSKANQLLHWQPRVDLQEALGRLRWLVFVFLNKGFKFGQYSIIIIKELTELLGKSA